MAPLSLIATTLIVTILTLTGPVAAQQTVLRLSSWLPPSHLLVKDVAKPWAEAVAKASHGRIQIQILDAPLGSPPAHFDLAATGAADITYGVNGYTPGRFALSDLPELPFLTPNAEILSVAYQRFYEMTPAAQQEYDGVKVLAVFTHGPGHLFTNGYDVTPIESLRGAKIRVPSAVTNQLAAAMNMIPLQAPAPKTYELLSSGVADGIFFPYETISFFRLDGIVNQALSTPGGLYNVAFFFVMNQGKWDALSDQDKAAIESVSGVSLARRAGIAWDRADAQGFAALQGRVAFHTPNDSETVKINAAAETVYQSVRERIESRGIDFDTALTALRSQIATAKAE